mmetsp:Transcript_73375/g.203705  ORF Transcript_73375/g.203705 Transcript_73375/m.203705 type:complete len:551 (+) Transcript_73375:74-1726(+)
MPSGSVDWYAVLGVPRGVSEAELKKAYRLRALQCHPDKGGTAAEFQRVLAAFEAISDPSQRQALQAHAAGRAGGSRKRSAHGDGWLGQGANRAGEDSRNVRPHRFAESAAHGATGARSDCRNVHSQKFVPGAADGAMGHAEMSPPVAKQPKSAPRPAPPADSETSGLKAGAAAGCLDELLKAAADRAGLSARLLAMKTEDLHALNVEVTQRRAKVSEATADGQKDGASRDVSPGERERQPHSEALLALEDGTVVVEEYSCASGGARDDTRPARLNRGIRRTKAKHRHSFAAFIATRNLCVYTQHLHTLESAVEAHIKLVQWRRSVHERLSEDVPFGTAVVEATSQMISDSAADDSIRLRLSFMVDRHQNGVRLVTPVTQVLDTALDFYQRVLGLFESADAGDLRSRAEALKNEFLATVLQERKQRNASRDAAATEARAGARSSRRLRVLEQMLQQEQGRRRKELMRRFGVATLPTGVGVVVFGAETCVSARVCCTPAAPIDGPPRASVKEAIADFRHLRRVLVSHGVEAARSSASQLELDEMTKRYTSAL